jgi:hypothetical protein
LGLPNELVPSGLANKTLYAVLFFAIRATRSVKFILFDLFTPENI